MTRPLTRTVAFLALAIAAFGAAGSPAARAAGGDLLVAPTRVVFEGRARAAELSIINLGAETASFRISLVNRRMTETGEFKDAEGPAEGERFAEGLVRFSPRQVTLPPGMAQTVRLQVRKPAELDEGEYRSHLLFRAVPPADAGRLSVSDLETKSPKGFSIRLTALMGVSIPVIVRHGETEATLAMRDLRLIATPGAAPVADVLLARRGSRSTYGDLVATWEPAQGPAQVLARASGVAVYTPNKTRRLRLPLKVPAGLALSGGRLSLSYEEPAGRTDRVRAEATIQLP